MESNITEAIILCGGLGTRLRKVFPDKAKSMVEIEGKPILYHIIKALREDGIKRVVLAVGYKSEEIRNYFEHEYHSISNLSADRSPELDIEIVYSEENTPLGTGGAIRQALNMVKTPQVLICNADTIITFPVYRMVDMQGNLDENHIYALYGNAIQNDHESISNVFTGVYVFPTKDAYLLDGETPFNLDDSLMQSPNLIKIYSDYHFLDIGTEERYFTSQREHYSKY